VGFVYALNLMVLRGAIQCGGCEFIRISAIEIAAPKVLSLMAMQGRIEEYSTPLSKYPGFLFHYFTPVCGFLSSKPHF